ncbi:MAG: L-Ala-D/L-Glu epimerase [Kordiimonadaceae bacterium]|nr:L-Ala-D/L-Glu epimerase [Kordiimonadaceae bacterium]
MQSTLTIQKDIWPLKEPFRISRGVKTEAHVVTVQLARGGIIGQGECTPYPRYGETPDTVIQQIEAVRPHLEARLTRDQLQTLLPAGAARNAVDCALWDLRAKEKGTSASALLNLTAPKNLITAVTIPIGTPLEMGAKAKTLSKCPLLKVKLGNTDILESVQAIRDNAPTAQIILDPNESWSLDLLKKMDQALSDMGVAMLEQPLAASDDEGLLGYDNIVPICADEACHTAESLAHLKGRYQIINIKLDKTGGLTGALALLAEAQENDFDIMIGCMVATSLAMAPAMLLAPHAKFIDLDGPVWMREDRPLGLEIQNGIIKEFPNKLWGG